VNPQRVFSLIGVALILATPAAADPVGLFPTGIASNGKLVPEGAIDPHYVVVSGPVKGATTVAVTDDFPIPETFAGTGHFASCRDLGEFTCLESGAGSRTLYAVDLSPSEKSEVGHELAPLSRRTPKARCSSLDLWSVRRTCSIAWYSAPGMVRSNQNYTGKRIC